MKSITILLCLALSGCGGSISGWESRRAVEFCEPRGGIDSMWTDPGQSRVTCLDGAETILEPR